MRFRNREDAGQRLARLLERYREETPLVLALPRGGVPVASEIARALEAPLDVWIVRKIGAPGSPELGLGAVAEGGVLYLDDALRDRVGASPDEIEDIIREQSSEAERLAERLRPGSGPPAVSGRTVIVVDDGIATGGTARAAIHSLRAAGANRIVLAVPVAASQSIEELEKVADAIVCLHSTPHLYAVGNWYEDFRQLEDEEVARILEERRQRERIDMSASQLEVRIPVANGELRGTLTAPASPSGLVLFAHGSGSGRLSPRNRFVASMMQRYGLATLLFDLLTDPEAALDTTTAEFRFDIGLLARRLVEVTDWALTLPSVSALRVGYFGSSTGAAAALVAAALRPTVVGAIVSRGGRPDLAEGYLARVRAPTLLIVGGDDEATIELNHRASEQLGAEKQVVLVPGATHLFTEPGALETVADQAGAWFAQHLGHRIAETVASEGEDVLAPE